MTLLEKRESYLLLLQHLRKHLDTSDCWCVWNTWWIIYSQPLFKCTSIDNISVTQIYLQIYIYNSVYWSHYLHIRNKLVLKLSTLCTGPPPKIKLNTLMLGDGSTHIRDLQEYLLREYALVPFWRPKVWAEVWLVDIRWPHGGLEDGYHRHHPLHWQWRVASCR